MTRRRTKATASSRSADQKRTRELSGVDIVKLFELLEDHYGPTSPYQRLYAQTRARLLKQGGPEAVSFAKLLEAIDGEGATGAETATRQAGFVVGFDVCRRLMLGDVDLEAVYGQFKAGGAK